MKLTIDKKYIVLPLGYHATKKKIEFYKNGELVFDIDATLDAVEPEYFQYQNVEAYLGSEIELKILPYGEYNFELIDEPPIDELYHEKYRPQFHFSAKRGWINDPNGLVYYKGTYHMFFQHNTAGSKWGNMTWGHAISKDLIHWDEKNCALYPDKFGTMFSGSAIVDTNNVTGLKTNDNDVILLYYTAAGGNNSLSKGQKFTQCMAYSTDGGESFIKYDSNPILAHIESENRDPKIIYSPELKAYIMALYLNDNRYALYTSVNLLRWELMQELTLPSDTECPDLYPLPVDGNKNNIKWVFSGASDRYLVGNISKGLYRPTQLSKRLHYGKNSYAAQTFSNIPEEDGRKIRIAWNTMETPNTYFNCSMCFPTEMTLKTLEGEESLCIWPVEEIKNLYKVTNTYADHTINHEQPLNIKLDGKGHDIELEITAHADSELRINLFGMDINCKVSENQVQFNNNTMPLFINQNKFKLRILVDTVGLEIFADQGQAHMCAGFLADYNLNLLEFKAVKGEIRIDKCKLSELTSIW